MSPAFFLAFGCLIFLAGLGFGVYAFVYRNKQKQEQSSYLDAEGNVTQLVTRMGVAGSASVFHPIVEFQANGQTYRFESDYGSRPAPYQVGQAVKVKYDPSNPQEAEVDSALSSNLGFGIFAFLAAIALCLGGGFVALSLLMLVLVRSS
jgi:hypothetical protein